MSKTPIPRGLAANVHSTVCARFSACCAHLFAPARRLEQRTALQAPSQSAAHERRRIRRAKHRRLNHPTAGGRDLPQHRHRPTTTPLPHLPRTPRKTGFSRAPARQPTVYGRSRHAYPPAHYLRGFPANAHSTVCARFSACCAHFLSHRRGGRNNAQRCKHLGKAPLTR